MLDLRERPMPGDGQMVEVAKDTAPNVAPEPLVDGGKQEIMPYAEFFAVCGCGAHQFVALRCAGAHRLFNEDIDARFKQRARRVKMPVGRQQDMNCIETLRREHVFKRSVDPGDGEIAREGLGFAEKAVANRHELHSWNSAEALSVPIGNVPSSEERDPDTASRIPCFRILHVR